MQNNTHYSATSRSTKQQHEGLDWFNSSYWLLKNTCKCGMDIVYYIDTGLELEYSYKSNMMMGYL